MKPEENTRIKIIPPKGHGKQIEIILSQDLIDKQRLDVLQKGCLRAWQDFVAQNNWKVYQQNTK